MTQDCSVGIAMDASNLGGQTILPEILNPASRWLFRYWESIRGEQCAAPRSRVEISPLRQQLPWIFIAERAVEGNLHPLRLAGTEICRLWGQNMTHKCLFASWSKFERDTMAGLFDGVLNDNQPFVMRVRARSAFGNSVSLEILGVPVVDDRTGAKQILGLVIPFRIPEWLGCDQLVAFELSAVRIIWTDAVPQQPVLLHPQRVAGGRKKPRLSIIRGGKDKATRPA